MAIGTSGINELLMKTRMTGDAKVNKQLKGIEKTGLKSANTIKNSLGTAMKAFMALAAVRGFTLWMRENVKLAEAQADAENKVISALKSKNRFTDQAFKSLKRYASSLQDIVNVGDEVTLEMQAMLISLTDLNEEGIDEADRAAVALSKKFKLDLVKSAELVALSIGTTSNKLTRLGIDLGDAVTEEEKLAKITEQTTGLFKEAQAELDTYSGIVEQTEGRYADWREEIGKVITENDVLKGAIKEVGDAFVTSTDEMSSGMSDFGKVVSDVVIGSVQALKFLGTVAFRVGEGINAIAGVANIPLAEIARSEVTMTEDLIKRFRFPGDFILTGGLSGERSSPAHARQAKKFLTERFGMDLTEFEGTTGIMRAGVAAILEEELLPKLKTEAARTEKIVEEWGDKLEAGKTKLQAFSDEMEEVLRTLRDLRDNPPGTPTTGLVGPPPGPPPPRPPGADDTTTTREKSGKITSNTLKYVTVGGSRVAIEPDGTRHVISLPSGFQEAPLAGGLARFTPLDILQARKRRQQSGSFLMDLGADLIRGQVVGADEKIPDTDDQRRAILQAAVPGLVTAGLQGGRQFGTAAFQVGTGLLAASGPWGMVAATVANVAFGWLTKDRREDPSEVVSVKVVNISDLVSSMLRITGTMRIRDAASGIDRLMYLRQRRLNVM